MTWSGLNVGDVVHLTRWCSNPADIWAVIEQVLIDDAAVSLLSGTEGTLTRWSQGVYRIGSDHEGMTVPPHDEVPDYVWAALAERRLTQ